MKYPVFASALLPRLARRLFAASVVACAPCSIVLAEVDERALYELAPEGSAFVRLINLTETEQVVRLGEQVLAVAGYCSASAYRPIEAGRYPLQQADDSSLSEVDSSLAYSIVIDKEGVALLPDDRVDSPRKSLVSVYNFTSLSGLSIKTSDGKHSVFSKLSSGDRVSRTINPVRATFSVFSATEKIADADTTIFERGVASTLLLCDSGTEVHTSWIRQ